MTKKEALEADLRKAEALNRLYQSPECQNYLLPVLRDLSKVRWLEVDKYENKDVFIYKYQEMKAKAQAYDELIRLLSGMAETEKRISTQLLAGESNYAI